MKRVYEKLRYYPNVVGVGRGFKYRNGKRTDEVVAVVNVSRKVSRASLRPNELIPAEVDGYKTDVLEIGTVRAFELNSMCRPLKLGYSVGHYAITAGTIGGIVMFNGNPAILSNNHVLANSNAGVVGDAILQPGPYDQTEAGLYRVAQLSAFQEIGFVGDIPSECNISQIFTAVLNYLLRVSGRQTQLVAIQAAALSNTVDCALAVLDSGVSWESECAVKSLSRSGIGEKVWKRGRTTEETSGDVTQIDATLQVQYGAGQIALFTDQVISDTLYSQPGDSGSGIRASGEDYHLKGLLFAGSDTVTVWCQPDNVKNALGFDFVA